MRSLFLGGLIAVSVLGCAQRPKTPSRQPAGALGQGGPPVVLRHDNPAFIATSDHQCAWETVVDVVDDYFEIEREDPVRLAGDVLTEGRLDTFPKVGATIFEPWLSDSANTRERVECTLQSIRRRALVRVIPTQGGYWVDLAVYKELEDVVQPEQATAGGGTFRYDSSLTRVVNPIGEQEINEGWIPLGRDQALEQKMLSEIEACFPGTR